MVGRMNACSLHNPFLGTPLSNLVTQRNNGSCKVKGTLESSAFVDFLHARTWRGHDNACLLQFGRRSIDKTFRISLLINRFKIGCTKEPFARSKDVVRSLVRLSKESLLLVRCTIFVAVISAVGLLVWYGQVKAKAFVEARLLPSVCSILSDYFHREINCGKVHSVSPFGISLTSCSMGPHSEEFSCGEIPRMKLRVRPFASLRSGKMVIDAVLSRPSILVAQKEDFSWLGIPLPSEGKLTKHHSSEEEIDYRTKTRRIAREEAAAQWARERNLAAREAAEMGYILPEHIADTVWGDDPSDDLSCPTGFPIFSCMDERMRWRDDHCVDTGVEYTLKHADLEKSFGVKIPRTSLSFWSGLLSRSVRHGLKRKAHKKGFFSVEALKCKNLDRSRVAALAYFHSLDGGKFGKPRSKQERPLSVTLKDDEGNGINTELSNKVGEQRSLKDASETAQVEEGKRSEDALFEVSDGPSKDRHDIRTLDVKEHTGGKCVGDLKGRFSFSSGPLFMIIRKLSSMKMHGDIFSSRGFISAAGATHAAGFSNGNIKTVQDQDWSEGGGASNICISTFRPRNETCWPILLFPLKVNDSYHLKHALKAISEYFASIIQKVKSSIDIKLEDLVAELSEGVDTVQSEGIEKLLPITLDSVYFSGGSLMLLGFGDREPREMENVNGHVKFQNHYGRVHVQLSGVCKDWRSGMLSGGGGFLATDVFVDTIEQKWHANLKLANLFAPIFERILDIPLSWSGGRASGEVHICMSKGESFPNLHGQLDVNGLAFMTYDSPSSFSEITANLCFRGQRIFVHNASGWFGEAPLEASGDFGLNPEDGEFHLMCQVPSVEVNALMRTFKMRPLMFPVAGVVSAVFNCQGSLDAPIFVGSGIISRKTANPILDYPTSTASESLAMNKEAGAVAAFDRIPFSYVSANFTFSTDNSVADLYGIRASLLDGGEIRGAGNAWICSEGELDNSAMDINLSGSLYFDKVLQRYLPSEVEMVPVKIGDLNGEAKLSGPLLNPRFDIKWAAPKAEDSFSDARGDIIISRDYAIISSSSVAFDLYTKVQTTYPDEWLQRQESNSKRKLPLVVEGVDLDLRLRGFDFFNLLSSYSFDSPRSMHLKATGRIKFQGKVRKFESVTKNDGEKIGSEINNLDRTMIGNDKTSLVGDVSLTGIRINQLMLAPQLIGSLSVSDEKIKLDATGRPDENLIVEALGPLRPAFGENLQKRRLSVSLQKGQLRANMCYQPQSSASLEVRQLPLDELEVASLRGTVQRAELQLNFQKRRGHGMLSLLRPKFSGVLGESLDLAARWSGDVITVEKTVLEQANSKYELQGEYVLPGSRDRYPVDKERGGFLKRAMAGHLGNMLSSMGRWRMRLEVPGAEVSEMLPLARLLSRSNDPAVRSRSKDFFMQSLQSVGFCAESLRNLLEAVQKHYTSYDEVIYEDVNLPGLAELRGRWCGSLDTSGGGNGDTMAEFSFRGEDWEWGSYRTQRVEAEGAYSNNSGLHLEQFFIQKDNATLHADGTLLGPKTNLHFAVLNFPIGLVPTLVQIFESSTSDIIHSLRQLLTPIKGILHMEGDLKGSLARPECDVQVRLLDGAMGGIDLGRAEIVASLTSTSRFLFNANIEPAIQSGHVHVQGSVPVTSIQNGTIEEDDGETDGLLWVTERGKEKIRGYNDESSENKPNRDKNEDGWDVELAEGLKCLNWNVLDVGEVRIDADVKDGGMMLITALCPYADWLHGNADIFLQVRGTVEQPIVNGSASFHKASVSSPVLQKPFTNIGGTVHVKSNRLCISSLEGRVSRKGKLLLKGDLPLQASELFQHDKVDLKCELLELHAKNILSGQVDSQIQITGSILQPNVSGMIKLNHGEAYLPHDKGNGEETNRLQQNISILSVGGYNRLAGPGNVLPYFGSGPTSARARVSQSSGKHSDIEKKIEQENAKPRIDIRLTDLKLALGPELRIIYPLILNFAVRGELELNGIAHPKWIRPKGVLTFENGDINLVATQVRLKRDHLNVAKFEPELGLDPILDLALVGSDWQFRIQSRASNWQDNLVVTSTRSVEQDALSPVEAARVFESQLAGSLLEGDGQLAFQKLARATLETLMPKIEGKGEFGQARWRLVYAPLRSLSSLDPNADPLKSLASNLSFNTEVEVQLGKRLQASIVRQMMDSEMATQWTLLYQLTSRLRVLVQIPSNDSKRVLFEYSATSQD